MSTNNLERLWASILADPSDLPASKTRPGSAFVASTAPKTPSPPPIGPTNRVAITQRIQDVTVFKSVSNLSDRIDGLIEKVLEAKVLLLQTDGRMNGAFDKMMENTTHLVNRVQARILEDIGTAAQADAVQQLMVSQKSLVEQISNMQQQMTAIQTYQTDLQATLATLTTQTQQISAQNFFIERWVTEKMAEIHIELIELSSLNQTVQSRASKGPSKRQKTANTVSSRSSVSSSSYVDSIQRLRTQSPIVTVVRACSPSSTSKGMEAPGSPLTGNENSSGDIDSNNRGARLKKKLAVFFGESTSDRMDVELADNDLFSEMNDF